MDIQGKKVVLHDMCLRDGMHAKRHQISLDEMVSIASGLDEALQESAGKNRGLSALRWTASSAKRCFK